MLQNETPLLRTALLLMALHIWLHLRACPNGSIRQQLPLPRCQISGAKKKRQWFHCVLTAHSCTPFQALSQRYEQLDSCLLALGRTLMLLQLNQYGRNLHQLPPRR